MIRRPPRSTLFPTRRSSDLYEPSSRRFDVTFELDSGKTQWRYTGTAAETVEVAIPSRAFARGELRSEEHTSELQSQSNLVCRLLLEKKKHRREIVRTLICPL